MNRSFDDYDECTEIIRGWDLELRKLAQRPFQAGLFQVACGGMLLSRGRLTDCLEQKGAAPRGMRTIGVTIDPPWEMTWRWQRVSKPHCPFVFPRNRELHALSTEQFHVWTLSLEEELIEEAGRMMGIPQPNGLLDRQEIPECSPGLVDRLRALCRVMEESLLGTSPERPSSPQAQVLTSELPMLLLEVLASSQPAQRPPRARWRDLAFRKAVSYVNDSLGEPMSVPELCKQVHVEQRTLEYAFRERLGISPKTYLKTSQLNHAHRALATAADTATVSDIANRAGFWHMGQFARDYRRLFGRPPSKTLRQSPSAARSSSLLGR